MKTATKILLVVVGLLFLADISWRLWVWHHYAEGRGVLKNFKVEYLHTNDWSGIGIFEARTEQPIWIKWNIGQNGSSMENCFFEGHAAFDVVSSSNHPPKLSVYFRKADKSVTWWLDRGGSGAFTERIFYNTNGDFFRQEVWYNNSWLHVEKQNQTNGIVVAGQWYQLAFDTNGNWTINTNR